MVYQSDLEKKLVECAMIWASSRWLTYLGDATWIVMTSDMLRQDITITDFVKVMLHHDTEQAFLTGRTLHTIVYTRQSDLTMWRTILCDQKPTQECRGLLVMVSL